MKEFKYFKPETLKEASDLFLEYGDKAHILNGGTDLIVRMRDEITNPEVVIDIKGIKELYRIKHDEKGVEVGACVKLSEIEGDKLIRDYYPLLAEAAHSVGSCQVRNKATMIGNICNASPLADTATPLLALDAVVIAYGQEGRREIPLKDFFVWVRKTSLKPGEIVTAIRIPAYQEKVFGSFQKLSRRKEVDLSTVCASVVKIGDSVRIALGSVAPTPVRVYKTEEFLHGKVITNEIIEEAKEMAASEVSPIDDVRASKEYRLEMVKVLVGRGLENVRQ